jgi:Protein of unknown function (DUF3592)
VDGWGQVRRRVTLRAASVAFVFVLAIGAPLLCLVVKPTWPQLIRLASVGRRATAIVTQLDLSNHSECWFTYHVDGHALSGSASCPVTHVGQDMTVIYDPSDPAVLSLDSPLGALLTSIGILLAAAIGFAFVVGGGSTRVYDLLYPRRQEEGEERPPA